jgi:hypothetical protein
MKRATLGFVVGLMVWVLVVSLLNRALRIVLPGYAAAEPWMSFTLGMMVARLTIGALTSLIAGAVAGWIAPASEVMPWLLGVSLLAAFIPQHLRLWSMFPLWYHLTFLVTLVPLIVLGSRLPRALAPATPAAPRAGS